ncbi:shikimate kinase [Sphingobacterium allocomposti]|jgi:shikimate kinase|uniref:Shikimate kinase n=1 Tax=Sphingobacterium allocomposti TaxID=415956 RepID=A0A5S5DNV7_9SPHI|nr:shikimate kinase [Sphingobacterium composti Yoo et al. 2007 non Ten et al. 2007]TYP97597.1 shikimate kinase [Sphingobacterium composti Yoo et al. 2007 non Ten et al. 2007]HLS97034.1 shikimate kinase [Sphingobacterium sp.]
MNKPIFLVGFMGSGKTTLGKKLALHLERKFVDLDEVIVERVGMSIPAYFAMYGEDSFRELEREVLHEQTEINIVVSTGGGSPCYFDNMQWILNNGLAIYLHLSPKALYSRLQQSNIAKRPALKGLQGDDLLHFIENKLLEREPFYKQAQLQIDQLHTSLDDLSQSIKQYATST